MMKAELTRALYLIKLVETLAATGCDPTDLLRHVRWPVPRRIGGS